VLILKRKVFAPQSIFDVLLELAELRPFMFLIFLLSLLINQQLLYIIVHRVQEQCIVLILLLFIKL
jgi:hypothetical protein